MQRTDESIDQSMWPARNLLAADVVDACREAIGRNIAETE